MADKQIDEIEDAARRMAEELAVNHDIDNASDGESVLIFYGASGGGTIEINLNDLARAALERQRESDDAGDVSDGHHTFNELYDHRMLLFCALMRVHPLIAWRAHYHGDGSMFDGDWFIAGMHLPTGDITYHLRKSRFWRLLDGLRTYECAPAWDGHTSTDVIDRLAAWLAVDPLPDNQ